MVPIFIETNTSIMKNFYTFSTLICSLFLCTISLSGQCIENPFAAGDCASVTVIQDVSILAESCYITGTTVSTEPQPIPLCPDVPNSSADNIRWIGFVAPEGNYSITISSSNCSLGDGAERGIQVGVYTDCTFQTAIFCDPNCTEGDKVLNSDLFTEGEEYYLFLDGCTGSTCEYRLRFDPTPMLDEICLIDGVLEMGSPTTCDQHTAISTSSFQMQTTCAKDWEQCQTTGLTQWHEIAVTDAATEQMLTYVSAAGFDVVWSVYAGSSLETSSPLAASNFGGFISTTCSSSDGDPSNSHIVPASDEPDMRYWIAVSATSALIESGYTIAYAPLLDCADCADNSVTNFYRGQIQTLVDGVATDGPFAPGQDVQVCVEYAHEYSDWFHGMIPNFGSAWLIPTTDISASNATVALDWYASGDSCSAFISGYDVPNLYTYEDNGQLKIRNTLETPLSTSTLSLADGSPLPSGWFVTTTGGSPDCTNTCSPSTSYGQPEPFVLSFCFDMTVRSDLDLDAITADALQIEMLPTTDLVTGCWTQGGLCLDVTPFVSPLWQVSCAAFFSDTDELCLDRQATLSSPFDLEWSTSTADICSVSEDGIVTPLSSGTCIVIAINTEDGGCELSKEIEILAADDTACMQTATVETQSIAKVYPNPTSDVLHLVATRAITRIAVSTTSGKLVAVETTNDKEVTLDIDHLPAGLYLVEIYTGEQSVVKKVIVTE